MEHTIFQGTHYQAGFIWGGQLKKQGVFLTKASRGFLQSKRRQDFAAGCLTVYERFFPEVLSEIQGIADAQGVPAEEFYTFLFSMYCFPYGQHCTCFAVRDRGRVFLCRNSDFLTELEPLYLNCLYRLNGVSAFLGNTTAFVELEDGINEHGLSAGLTFVCPKVTAHGFNAGLLIRYILEKCRTTAEALIFLKEVPIASQQAITLADKTGDIAVAECNAHKVCVLRPLEETAFVAAVNRFQLPKMRGYNVNGLDDWRAKERYQTVMQALSRLRQQNQPFTKETLTDILSGKYGFICQYDRNTGADTVWSSVYDLKNQKIYRAEGNPQNTPFRADTRLFAS